MVKRMKRILAIAAACVLTLSMGTVAFAASPVDPEIPGNGDAEKPSTIIDSVGLAKDKDGNTLTITFSGEVAEEVEKVLEDGEQVKEILTDAGYIPKENQDITVIGVTDIKLPDAMPEGGLDIDIPVNDGLADDLKDGDTVYVLHKKADGTWEVLEGTVSVGEDGTATVNAHFDSLSPVAIIKVMSDGSVVTIDNAGNNQQIPPTPSKPSEGGKDEVIETVPSTPSSGGKDEAAQKPSEDKKDAETAKNVKTSNVKLSPKTGK